MSKPLSVSSANIKFKTYEFTASHKEDNILINCNINYFFTYNTNL